jgi:hypothetical protein
VWGGGNGNGGSRIVMRTIVAQSPAWIRGVEGGGGGGESTTLRHGRGRRGEKEERWWSTPFMAARWREWRGKGQRDPEVGAPRGVVWLWGLAPTVGRRPDRVPAAVRTGRTLCLSRGGSGCRVTGAWGLAGSGRERRVNVWAGRRNGVG